MPDELGDPAPPPEDVAVRARMVVCSYAESAGEARDFLEMLGLMPGQPSYEYVVGPVLLPNSSNDAGLSI